MTIRPILVAVAAMLATGAAHAAPVDAARQEAEALGRAIYEAEGKHVDGDMELADAARQRVSGWCNFTYKSFVVPRPSGNVVAFMAQPRASDSFVMGRHFLVDANHVEVSTKTCLAVPKPDPAVNAIGGIVSHLMSATPSAFHVYVSLKLGQPLFVSTSDGVWKVDQGAISWCGPTMEDALKAQGMKPRESKQ